jgi:polyhydroxybutyrate depolymerase
MNRHTLHMLVLVTAFAAALPGCGAPAPEEEHSAAADALAPTCAGKPMSAGDRWLTVTTDQGPRDALVHVPKRYRPRAGSSLVLDLHHYNGTPEIERALTGTTALSDERGFLLVYPAGIGGAWNAGKCCGQPWLNDIDDVGFIRDLIDAVVDEYCVDPRRVYVTGMSNGGLMAHRLGQELSDRIAAIAPVAAVSHVAAPSQPVEPVSVLHVHGTADDIIPYEGGQSQLPFPIDGDLLFESVSDSMARWRAANGCTEQSHHTYVKENTTCTAWSHCSGGAEVELCAVSGGGHTWPGGGDLSPIFGYKDTDFHAAERIIDFFEEHAKP